MTMPVYAVTGASGHLGRFALEQLLGLFPVGRSSRGPAALGERRRGGAPSVRSASVAVSGATLYACTPHQSARPARRSLRRSSFL